MAQSFCQIYVHMIFSTKNRVRWLDSAMCGRAHSYMATIARDCGCPYVFVGGVEDHVHILLNIGKNEHPVKILAKIKQESSKHIKTLGNDYRDFHWQNGYGMFSVSPSQTDVVEKYITNQADHHKKKSFQEEFLAFLQKYGLTYDEKYIWD